MAFVKAVVFDFDDTLVHSGWTSYNSHCRAARKLGLPKPALKQFLKYWGKSWHSMIEAIWPGADINEFIRTYRSLRLKSRYPLVYGAVDTIDFLYERRIPMGIVSNKPTEDLVQRISHTALNPHVFAFVFGEQSTIFHKPHARAFDEVKEFFSRKRIRSNEILYVGDLTVDYFAARGAGLQFVGVLSGFHSKRMFLKEGLGDEWVLDSVAELPRFLLHANLLPVNRRRSVL
ncbi:MAG: HAD family hydrolase [Candidatus Diapherotrites archaeon]|nr:HAD family hydrolase [Candidatus Diapherotrites archaeon]